MQISLNTELQSKDYDYIIMSWVNAKNPSLVLGERIVHTGFGSHRLGGFGSNGKYIFFFYGSSDGTTKEALLDTMVVSTTPEVFYRHV